MDRLLRIDEVSELTGVPKATLRYWRQRDVGPRSAKLGRRIVYRERDVIAWVDERFDKTTGCRPSDVE